MELTELGEIKTIVESNLPCATYGTGKMLRSKTALLVLKSLGITISQDVLEFLSAVELVHNASLLHDDVIDNENTRRNNPSCNIVYGNKKTVLYGNIVLSNAINLILKLNRPELIAELNNCVKKMCLGELLQQEQMGKIPTLEEYLEKSKLKTATLFKFAMTGICVLTGIIHRDKLEDFGENFGLAFQICNDLTDYTDDEENCADVTNGIYTAPVIFANSVKTNNVAIAKTKSLIDNYLRRAEDAFEILNENEYKRALIGVIECLNK